MHRADAPPTVAEASRIVAPAGVLWALPWLVVFELVGSTYGAPLLVSLVYYALLVLIMLGVSRAEAANTSASQPRGPARWAAGVLLLALGLALTAGVVAPLWGVRAPRLVSPRLDVGLPLGFLGCWCVSVGLAWVSGRRGGWQDLERFGLLLGLAFLALLAGGHRIQGLAVFPLESWACGLAVGLSVVVTGLAVTSGKWLAVRFAILLLVGVTVRSVGFGVWYPDPAVRDMLPLAQSAGDALARGEHPYGVYQMQHGSLVPLTYLPGLWGLHNLPRLLGLPFRLTSLAADVLIVACFWWVAAGFPGEAGRARKSLALSLGAVWMSSPSVQWNLVYAEPHPWWGVMALTFASALRRRWALSACCLGVAVATRQFAWFLAPFWMLWAWRALTPAVAVRRVLLAVGVALSLVLPFAVSEPGSFWFGTLRWFGAYGPAHRAWFVERLGFAGSFYTMGLEGWLMPLQFVVAIGVWVSAWFAKTEQRLLATLTLGYALFVMLGLVIWDSFYLGIFVMVSLVGLGSSRSPAFAVPAGAARVLARLPPWVVAVTAVEGLMVLWLGYGFWSTGSELGLRDASAALGRHLKPRDVVLDVARPRLAFVQPPLSLRAPLGVRVVGDEFESDLGELGWFAAPRLGLLHRADWEGGRAERLSRLGEPVASGGRGFYSWLVVERGELRGRLSDGLNAARMRSTNGKHVSLVERSGAYGTFLYPEVAVTRRSCFIGGRPRSMLHLHPSDEGTLELAFVGPPEAKRLILIAGFDDRVVRWDRASVTIAVWLDGQEVGALEVPNSSGAVWDVYAIPAQGGKSRVALRVRTTDDRQRRLCVEGLWL